MAQPVAFSWAARSLCRSFEGDYLYWYAEGDSITAPHNYPLLYSAARVVVTDNAVAGSTLTTLNARAVALDAQLANRTSHRKYLLSVLIGYNDFVAGTSSATFLANLASYLDARKTAGWDYVIVGTQLPSTTSGYNAWRNTNNPTISTWVGSHADAVFDFAANATMGPDAAASNLTYYSDGVHPTAAGQVILKNTIAPTIDSYIPPP